ncbi:hypothetical protein [Fluviicola sp.]|jgi:hypothetical protein|uniref:hypothetical protein n=1 Tax=Fluviicola sp. TaxID=1917219 RepID=UPI00281EF70D|nr:hypothetical protein [Fluviicola sp.]MDR0802567.1 hypothetical protein [Fluviicola sp.]
MNYFSDYSLWWLLPISIFAIGFSFYYYFRTDQRSVWNVKQLGVLFSFRALGLFLLGLLLLGLVWETIKYRPEKPLIITLVDSSSSMLNYKDSNRVKKDIEGFRTALPQALGEGYEYLDLAVGTSVRDLDQLAFKDKSTDLSAGFKQIKDRFFNRNIGAIVLISDGNYNQGVHPMYEAERIELTPVFALAAGDTTLKRDIVVRSVSSNELAFLNNEFPVQTLIDFQRVPAGSYQVNLLQDGKVIQSQKATVSNTSLDQKEFLFTVPAKIKGYHRFTVSVQAIKGEFTKDNNQQSCFVEIIDSKSNVLLLASAPHPDVAALRSVFELDQEAVVTSELMTNYTLGNKIPDFVVWYENGLRPNVNLFKQIQDRGIPVLMILGPNVSTSLMQNYGLAIKTPTGNQYEDVYPVLADGFNSFGLSADFTSLIPVLTPLRTKFGGYKLPSNSIVVLNQRVGNVSKNDPLIAVAQTQKAKIGFILGEGLWRWKMKEFMQKKTSAGFEEFVQKLTQYISVKQNREPLRVTLPKRFNTIEDIVFKAEFYNESMELITTPTVEMTITKRGGKSFKQLFSPTANFYQLNVGQLTSGTYDWKVVADNNGKKYLKSGSFAVDEISLEDQDTRANFSTLNQLAVQSDGSYKTLDQYQALIREIKKRGDITTVQYEDTGYQELIDWKWIFALIILLFTAEWFLRRWWGSY